MRLPQITASFAVGTIVTFAIVWACLLFILGVMWVLEAIGLL